MCRDLRGLGDAAERDKRSLGRMKNERMRK